MNIAQDRCYIDPSVWFDNYDYSLIEVGENVTISREVLFLTHDFSISKGLYAMGIEHGGRFAKGITVERNCFIGARTVLLPGTHIGANTVIGAGAVVKGKIPNDSIVVGNPSKIIANSREWGRRHYAAKDYIEN